MRTKPPRERESKVQRSIVVRLRRLGLVLFRRNVGAREWTDATGIKRLVKYGGKGQADLYGWDIRTGRHWEIEVKRPDEVPTPKQTEWLRECTRLGAVAFWGDNCNTIDIVAEAIQAGGRVVWLDGFWFDVELP